MFQSSKASLFVVAVVVGSLGGVGVRAEPVVWTGPEISFSKANFVNASDPANQDLIVPGVAITRGDHEGIYNAASETSYTHNLSPAGTEWAFPVNNPGKAVSAANWADLAFNTWEVAVGNNPPGNVGQPAVLHLVDDDIYLDILFTSWTQGGGGGFSYTRSTAGVVPEPGVGGVVAGLVAIVGSARTRRRERY